MAGQAVISGPALQAVITTLETLAGVRLEPVARAALLHTLSSLTTYQYEVLSPALEAALCLTCRKYLGWQELQFRPSQVRQEWGQLIQELP